MRKLRCDQGRGRSSCLVVRRGHCHSLYVRLCGYYIATLVGKATAVCILRHLFVTPLTHRIPKYASTIEVIQHRQETPPVPFIGNPAAVRYVPRHVHQAVHR